MTDLISHVTPNLITHFMLDLKPLAAIGISIYFLWILLPLVIGTSTGFAQEIMMKVLVWSLVFAIVFDPSGLLGTANTVVKSFYNWASGSNTIVNTLDNSYDKIVAIGESLYRSDDTYFKLTGTIAKYMVLISYYLFGLLAMGYLIFSKVILNLLLLSLPLAILAILFPAIKSIFSNWLQMFIENILTVLFLNIMFTIVQSQLNTFIAKAESIASSPTPGNIGALGMEVSSVILFMMFFVIMSKKMASHLASATMSSDSISAAGGAAGRVAGGAASVAKKAWNKIPVIGQ